LKFTWKAFKNDFQEKILTEFRYHVKNMEKEVTVSHLIETSHDRDVARSDREEKEKRRKSRS